MLDETTSWAFEWTPRFDDHRIEKDKAKLAWRAARSGEGHYALAQVEAVTADGMVVLLSEPLVAGQSVWIQEQPSDRVATVLCCVKRVMRYLVILKLRPLERRRESRLLAGGNGTLHWGGPDGVKSAMVSVCNMTESGMQLEVPERLQATQSIRLSGETWECHGIVRYCRPEGGRLVAGVQFTRPPYPKNSLEYQD